MNSVIGNPSEYQHFWTVFVLTKVDNTVKNRERKSWRGEPNTPDYRAGYEKALLTARNLQSERDRVVNELRKLSNETGKGKQYSVKKTAAGTGDLTLSKQNATNKHGNSDGICMRSGLTLFCISTLQRLRWFSMHGVPRIVNARRRLRQLMVGPGWGPAKALPVDGIYHGPICLPIPINTVYVGLGNQEIFLRPSPWCNPLFSLLRTSRRPIGSLLSLGVPVLTKFNGCLQFLKSSWHVTAVSQNATLLCLMN